MDKFCSNPDCPNHISVNDEIILRGEMKIENPNTFEQTLLSRHEYVKSTGEHIFLCSVCKNAVMMAAP